MLAELHHLHHQKFQEDILFWSTLVAEYGDPVLELGCGSGRVLLALAQNGVEMHGVDNDPAVLEILKKNAKEQRIDNLKYWQADMTSFSSEVEYPLIISPCNTYSTLTAEQRQTLLENVKKHISSSGVFGASVPNPTLLANLPEEGEDEVEDAITHPKSGNPVQVSSSWKRIGDQVIIVWHYDHLLPNGELERQTASTVHQLCTVEQYQQEFNQAGFDIVETYGDFVTGKFETESEAYIFLITPKS